MWNKRQTIGSGARILLCVSRIFYVSCGTPLVKSGMLTPSAMKKMRKTEPLKLKQGWRDGV